MVSKKVPINENSTSKFKELIFMFFRHFIIISKLWWQVLFMSFYSFTVIALNFYYPRIFYIGGPDSMVPILGLVTSLLLVFRTNTAYDRFYEGRRLWSLMTQVIRVMVRAIWTILPEKTGREIVEKKSVTNILVGFAIASKHYLREEYSYDHIDLKKLINHFPRIISKSRQDALKNQKNLNYAPPSNIPLQILFYVAIFIQTMKIRHTWDPAMSGIFYNGLNSLTECLSGFERIKRTPIPPAYSIHLYHVIWLYVLSLPFQLADSMGWWTVAAVGITAFTFLGILEIGYQIEDPFGYDDNDLPLDDLCNVLSIEIDDILSSPFPSHETLFISDKYRPVPNYNATADELSTRDTSEVRALLRQTPEKNHMTLEPVAIHNLNDLIIGPYSTAASHI